MKNPKTIILILVAILVFITIYIYTKQTSTVIPVETPQEIQDDTTATTTTPTAPQATQPSLGIPNFAWNLKLGSKNGETQTTVSLTATYPNKSKVTKTIATVPGTCNTYDDRDANAFKNSTMILCYGAGGGTYFKIVKTTSGYSVQKKDFEEAVPGYNPPARSYQTVTTFR